MLREDFKTHSIWATLAEIDLRMESIRSDNPSAQDLSSIDVITQLASHLRRWHAQRDRLSPYFNEEMVAATHTKWLEVLSSLDYRVQNGAPHDAETRAAANHAEESLTSLGAWPALYPTKKDEESEQTVFEDILESQRKALDVLDTRNAGLLKKIEQLEADLNSRVSAAAASVEAYESTAARIEATVSGQTARVDEVVDRATRTVGELNQQNSESFDEWTSSQEKKFDEQFQPFIIGIDTRLEKAKESLERLQKTESEFANLSSAAAADKLAGHFKSEARVSRVLGFVAYVSAVALAAGGVVPLVILIVESSDAGTVPSWPTVVIRLSISVVAASAAGVFVNLGSRFFTQGTVSKRTELELRTINPLLANVEKRTDVDATLIKLVDRSFGVPPTGETSKESESVAFSTSAIIDIITNALKRS